MAELVSTEHIQSRILILRDRRMLIDVFRAFVRLRAFVVNHKALAAKLAELHARVGAHDDQLAAIIATVRQLTSLAGPRHHRKIGFHRGHR